MSNDQKRIETIAQAYARYTDPAFCTDAEFIIDGTRIVSAAKSYLNESSPLEYRSLVSVIEQLQTRIAELNNLTDEEFRIGTRAAPLIHEQSTSQQHIRVRYVTETLEARFPNRKKQLERIWHPEHVRMLVHTYDEYETLLNTKDPRIKRARYTDLRQRSEDTVLRAQKLLPTPSTTPAQVNESAKHLEHVINTLVQDAHSIIRFEDITD